MAAAGTDFDRIRDQLPQIRAALQQRGPDGWLLSDRRARKAIACRQLGFRELSRRHFVMIPARREPVAITHGMGQGPWRTRAARRAQRGHEADDLARGAIDRAANGEWFIHRTGHSIDIATHGMDPAIDNIETRETPVLAPRVGFSIEPGVCIPVEMGIRTEIQVHIGADGREVRPARSRHAVASCT